jgi:hypothetical protein
MRSELWFHKEWSQGALPILIEEAARAANLPTFAISDDYVLADAVYGSVNHNPSRRNLLALECRFVGRAKFRERRASMIVGNGSRGVFHSEAE